MSSIVENRRKHLLSLGVILALLSLTAYFLLRNQELPQLLALIRSVNPKYLLIALGTMAAFFACEALCLKLLTRSFAHNRPFHRYYAYSLMGFYFSSITPGCAGGQPSQIYYMGRDGIPVGSSSLALLIFNLAYHLAVLLVAAASWLVGGVALVAQQPALKYLMLYGALVQGALVVVFLAAVFSKRLMPALVNGAIGLLHKLHLLRDRERALAKVEDVLQEYRRGAEYIKQHPRVLWQVLGIAVVHLLLLYSIAFWVYQALGLSGQSFLTIVAMQAALTLALESLPIPGSIGVTETSFLLLYGTVFGAELVLPALLLCRGLNYYLGVGLGGLLCAWDARRKDVGKRSEKSLPLSGEKIVAQKA